MSTRWIFCVPLLGAREEIVIGTSVYAGCWFAPLATALIAGADLVRSTND